MTATERQPVPSGQQAAGARPRTGIRTTLVGRWSPGWRQLAVAIAAGALLAGSMPPRSAWYLAPVGACALTWALLGLRWRPRLLLGAAAGLAFFLPTLSWLTDFHPAGFIGLVLIEVALFAAAMLLVVPRPGGWWTVPAALVVLEVVRARFPFGGFPIPGLALGQLDGPFATAAPLGGSLLVVGLATGAGAGLTGLVTAGRRARATVVVAGLVAVSVLGVVLGAPEAGSAGSLRAVLVQGGGPRGIPAVASDADAVSERQFRLSEDLPESWTTFDSKRVSR